MRLFDLDETLAVESRHGLAPSTLITAAFDETALHALARGRVPKRAWLDGIAERTGTPAAAVDEWAAQPVTVDTEVKALGLLGSFDGLLVSAELGEAKPDRALFDRVAADLGAEHHRMLLVDDTRANVDGAVAAGLEGHLHTDAAALRTELARLGVLS
ncbi:HAD family hydrolase [Nocardioides sp. CFH 31398]|uniref:HAD family hydrolase n=1 Tax=Nocardioides sp. CFH 31398 TaxID=2919579 RepID=UPI001F059C23|nr:HAD-IA family hydrolase [Nocardioides sp. CFH 31398]MCH1867027.1 HAD-IA family hydrolase [Nocardioides sp. CFH 31398]